MPQECKIRRVNDDVTRELYDGRQRYRPQSLSSPQQVKEGEGQPERSRGIRVEPPTCSCTEGQLLGLKYEDI